MLESKAQNLKITESILQTTHIPKHLSPTISLLGGEPLLNNNITQYFRILQKYFPNSTIWLITNALLLPKMPHEFWQTCKECNITLRPTKYPVKINWDDIFAKCEKYGVVLDFFNDAQVEKVSFKTAMNFKGEGDIFDNFINCHRANSCTELHNGRIYPCAIAAHIKHFNEYFDKKLVQSNLDSLDIHKSDITQNEILNFMARPIPFCRYCEIKKMTYKPWSSSSKSIDEYEV